MKLILFAALILLAGCSKPPTVYVYVPVTPPPKTAYDLELERQVQDPRRPFTDEEKRIIGAAIYGAEQQKPIDWKR